MGQKTSAYPASAAAAALATSGPELQKMQAAMESSRAAHDAAKKSLESSMDALMLFKANTEKKIADIQGTLEHLPKSGPEAVGGSVPSDVQVAIRDLKTSISRFNNKLKLQHVQAGLFT